MPKFKIDIWFDQKPKKLFLGSVTVEAINEEKAYKIAVEKTEHWMMGRTEKHQKLKT